MKIWKKFSTIFLVQRNLTQTYLISGKSDKPRKGYTKTGQRIDGIVIFLTDVLNAWKSIRLRICCLQLIKRKLNWLKLKFSLGSTQKTENFRKLEKTDLVDSPIRPSYDRPLVDSLFLLTVYICLNAAVPFKLFSVSDAMLI